MAGVELAGKSFLDTVSLSLGKAGYNLLETNDMLRCEASEAMAYLSTIIGHDGFEEAVRARRDLLAIKAGMLLTKNADEADMRIIGLIEGALRMGALFLAGGV